VSRGELVQGGRVVGRFGVPGGSRIEPRFPPRLPEGNLPLDRTPRPDGLAVDENLRGYALKRLSPFRSRWPELLAFDERVHTLEARQARLNEELAGLRERLTEAQAADREAMARWAAGDVPVRPLPTAAAVEQLIVELTDERDGLITAAERTLDAKVEYVEEHRKRLVREAGKARKAAVTHLQDGLQAAEKARLVAVDCIRAERWAAAYPNAEADAHDLRLEHTKGGRVSNAIPELTAQTTAAQAAAWLRDDAGWLGRVLDDEQRRQAEPDPHEQAIWENTDEGRKAIALANRRLAESVAPRNVGKATWE